MIGNSQVNIMEIPVLENIIKRAFFLNASDDFKIENNPEKKDVDDIIIDTALHGGAEIESDVIRAKLLVHLLKYSNRKYEGFVKRFDISKKDDDNDDNGDDEEEKKVDDYDDEGKGGIDEHKEEENLEGEGDDENIFKI